MSTVIMKRNSLLILILALSVAFSIACSKNANTGNSTNSNAGNTSSGSSGGTNASSPTAALKAYYEAANRKDIATAKKYLSAGTMRLMEEGAKKMGKSVDEAFKESAEQTNTSVMPEFSNEKISGDTATVDIKAQGQTVTMPMVKEDGQWKLAMDKMIENLKNAMGGSQPSGNENANDGDDDDHEGHDEK